MKRSVLVAVTIAASGLLVHRGYYCVDDTITSLLPLFMCLLFAVSILLTLFAWFFGDGLFSGIRSPD